MTNNILSNQDLAVGEYVARIKAEMTKATTAWKSIAHILAAAVNDFGWQSDLMRSLLKQTKFSESKASKLIAIANSSRLKHHTDDLKSVEAWTVLYQITTLSDEEFKRLLDQVDADTVITQSNVHAVRTKDERKTDNYKTLFNIQIDENAIKSSLFSEDDYNELLIAVQNIQDTMNYVRVLKSARYESEVARFHDDVEREVNKLIRKVFAKEKQSSSASIKNKNLATDLMHDRKYTDAFDTLKATTLDIDGIRTEAQKNVRNKREEKFIHLASDYDAFANTAILQAA